MLLTVFFQRSSPKMEVLGQNFSGAAHGGAKVQAGCFATKQVLRSTQTPQDHVGPAKTWVMATQRPRRA